MSAQDNLSTEAFRAVLGTSKLKEPVGQYWSTDHNEPYEYIHWGTYGEKPPAGPHLIVEAQVNPKDDMPEKWSDARKPLVLKPGSAIKVKSITKVTPGKRQRIRTYKKGKEMKA